MFTVESRGMLDTKAVSVLVGSHRRFLAFLAPRVSGREAAEEILQAAFVKAVEKGGALRKGESVVAWFYRLLRNALADHYRRKGIERRAIRERAGRAESAEDRRIERVVCACVTDLLATLEPGQAELLRRVDLNGEAVAAAAAVLGITPNNAGVRLHRARAELKKQLVRSCGTCTEHGCLDCTCEKPC